MSDRSTKQLCTCELGLRGCKVSKTKSFIPVDAEYLRVKEKKTPNSNYSLVVYFILLLHDTYWGVFPYFVVQ